MSAFDHHYSCQHYTLYRMSCEDFDALYADAQGRCQICDLPEAQTKRGKLVIDHAGPYGVRAVRGLLCDKCNRLMGRVDAGEVVDIRAHHYRYNAWFMRVLRERTTPARRYAVR